MTPPRPSRRNRGSLDRILDALNAYHYGRRTEETRIAWDRGGILRRLL